MNDNQEIGCLPRLACMIGAVIVLLLLMCSCAATKQIEWRDREVEKWNTKVVHDTVRIEDKDSTYHSVIQNGDTIYDTKYIEHIKYRDKVVIQRDTIVTVQKEKEYIDKVIEKQVVPKWCYYCLVVCIAFLFFAIIKIYRYIK